MPWLRSANQGDGVSTNANEDGPDEEPMVAPDILCGVYTNEKAQTLRLAPRKAAPFIFDPSCDAHVRSVVHRAETHRHVAAGPSATPKLEDGAQVKCVAFAPSGEVLLIGDSNGIITVWDPFIECIRQRISAIHHELPMDSSIGSKSSSQSLQGSKIRSSGRMQSEKHSIEELSWAPSGRSFAAAISNQQVKVYVFHPLTYTGLHSCRADCSRPVFHSNVFDASQDDFTDCCTENQTFNMSPHGISAVCFCGIRQIAIGLRLGTVVICDIQTAREEKKTVPQERTSGIGLFTRYKTAWCGSGRQYLSLGIGHLPTFT